MVHSQLPVGPAAPHGAVGQGAPEPRHLPQVRERRRLPLPVTRGPSLLPDRLRFPGLDFPLRSAVMRLVVGGRVGGVVGRHDVRQLDAGHAHRRRRSLRRRRDLSALALVVVLPGVLKQFKEMQRCLRL